MNTVLLGAAAALAEVCPSLEELLDGAHAGLDSAATACIAADGAGADAVLTRLESDPEDAAWSRALALVLLHQVDQPLTGAQARALLPADRRLVRDAVYAARGRKTPSAEHSAVFSNYSWYEPDPRFTNGRMRDADRQRVAFLDDPPREPEPEPAAAAVAEGGGGAPQESEGNSSWWTAAVVGVLGFIGLVVAARRPNAENETATPPRQSHSEPQDE